jgi:hypothetical protein
LIRIKLPHTLEAAMVDDLTNPREIARDNIEHFGKLLKTALSDVTRATVERLLVEEKAKLAALPILKRPVPDRPSAAD